MKAKVSSLPGSLARERFSRVMPFALSPGSTDSMPGVSVASRVASVAAASGTSTMVWLVSPAEKDFSTTACACTDSGLPRSWSACDSPTEAPIRPRLRAPSAATDAAVTTIGRRCTPRPRRVQKPGRRSVPAPGTKRGMKGQNRPRPQTMRAAGSTTRANTMAMTTPMAQAKPRARLPDSSANSRVRRLSATVPPLAAIAGPAPRTAASMASLRFSVRSNSSR